MTLSGHPKPPSRGPVPGKFPRAHRLLDALNLEVDDPDIDGGPQLKKRLAQAFVVNNARRGTLVSGIRPAPQAGAAPTRAAPYAEAELGRF